MYVNPLIWTRLCKRKKLGLSICEIFCIDDIKPLKLQLEKVREEIAAQIVSTRQRRGLLLPSKSNLCGVQKVCRE